MHTALRTVLLGMLLALTALAVACGAGESAGETLPSSGASATGEAIKIGFDEGFTGFMAPEALTAEKGILTALEMVNGEWMGRPIEYKKADNGSDPVVAVDKARQLVESDGIQFMVGPIFSPATAAVTDYLSRSSGIPQCSVAGQPSDNLKAAHQLAFMPNGLYGSQGYYFGKYVAEQLGYRTANCLSLEDTAGRQLQDGFKRGFAEGGGRILSSQYVPIDTVDFSSYLSTLKDADCTSFWIFGNGAPPFVKQYNDYGLTAPLVSPMSTFIEPQLAELGDLAIGIVACDYYSPELDNALNKEFVEKYREMWDGEYPNATAYGGYQAVLLFLGGVKKAGGDTTPSSVIEAMSTMSIDTPSGTVTMSPYKDAYVGTRDWFIVKTERVGDRITWVPVYTYEQVLLGE